MSNTLSIILFVLSGFLIGFAIVKFILYFRRKALDRREEEWKCLEEI